MPLDSGGRGMITFIKRLRINKFIYSKDNIDSVNIAFGCGALAFFNKQNNSQMYSAIYKNPI